jgi:hypothetical protein|tara:strand:- start:2118 stop:3017 length:900 start_codon:yes stop_codon:yes gene_type:complete
MASTYTTNIRLTKQGDGDNANTWGEILNNVLSLVDQAVGSYTTITVGATSSVALTENQGSADQSRSAVLEIAGTVGGAHTSIFVYLPAGAAKTYAIKNAVSANTTASDAVVLRVAGQTHGVTVPSGGVGYFFTNGTSVNTLNAAGFSAITTTQADARYVAITGTQTITGAKTFTSTVTITGAAAFTSAVNVSGPVNVNTVTLTDAASIVPSFDAGNTFVVTLGGNRTLAAPTSANIGQSGSIRVIQDATGGRTLSYNSAYQFVSGSAPVMDTSAGAQSILVFSCRSATTIDAVMLHDFK